MSSYYFNPDEVRRLTELREAIMLSVKKEIAQGLGVSAYPGSAHIGTPFEID